MLDEELRRLSQWKQPRERTAQIGPLLHTQFERVAGAQASSLTTIHEILRGIEDASFQRHCRALEFRRGVLTIAVDDPGMVAELRRRHLFGLRDRLQAALPHMGVTDIQFRAEVI